MFEHLPPAWQAAVTAFLASRRTAWMQQAARSALSGFFGDLSISPAEVTQADIVAYLAAPGRRPGRAGTPLTKNARQRYLTHLQDFFRFASTYESAGVPLYQQTLPTTGLRKRMAARTPVQKAADFAHFSEDWQAATQAFLNHLYERNGSERTLESYRAILARFFAAPRQPDAVTRTEILAFLDAKSEGRRRPGQPVMPATRNLRLCVLISFYKWAANWVVTSDDGSERFLYTKVPPTHSLYYARRAENYRSMSEEELEAFFAQFDSSVAGLRDKSLFLCFFTLARRRSELIALRWGDIEPTMIVESTGRRRQGYQYHFRGKGHKRLLDTQEMPEYTYNAIVDYLQVAGRYQDMQPGDYIWRALLPGQGREDGEANRPLHHNYVNTLMRKYLALAGIAHREGLSLHSLRHASALHRYQAGEDILSIKALLRHSNLATTSVYLDRLQGISDPFADRLQEHFSFLR